MFMWTVTLTVQGKNNDDMICLRCENQEFVRKEKALIEQEFKGELLKVKSPALACSKCGWITVGLDQLDDLRRRTADAYRDKHGLLTGDQIRRYRKLLGKSQREFAAFLRVGEASVKRWETWLVQEKGSDELIRTKCENELCQRLQHQVTTTVWVSFQYVKSTHHKSHATSVLAAGGKPSVHGAWLKPSAPDKLREKSQPELANRAANEELALAA